MGEKNEIKQRILLKLLAKNHNLSSVLAIGIFSHHKKAGIIFGGNCERFAHFSAKNLIVFGLMGEKSHSEM